MGMKISRRLEVARALIADKRRWWDGKGVYGKKRCAYTALGFPPLPPAVVLLDAAAWLCFELNPAKVNDCLGHRAVLEIYDLAISIARGDEEAP